MVGGRLVRVVVDVEDLGPVTDGRPDTVGPLPEPRYGGCACVGCDPNEPVCVCAMQRVRVEGGRFVRVSVSAQDTGMATSQQVV